MMDGLSTAERLIEEMLASNNCKLPYYDHSLHTHGRHERHPVNEEDALQTIKLSSTGPLQVPFQYN